MSNSIMISDEERKAIIKLLEAYKGMVDQTIKQLSKKRKYYQQGLYDTCIKCSKEVEILIKNLSER